MANIQINFRCPEELVGKVDAAAAVDQRDRSGMLNKILSLYFSRRPSITPTESERPARGKKKK